MKIIYIVDYDLNESSGKSKATREKINVLKELVGSNNLKYFSHTKSKFLFIEFFKYLFFDLKVFINLFFIKRDEIIIRRVLFLPLVTLLLKIKGNRVFTECHTDFADEISHFDKNALQKFVLKSVVSLSDLTFNTSTGILYNHPSLQDKFDKIYKKPSIYTYNGANTKEYYPLNLDVCRSELGLDQTSVYFLFIGSVSKWHGVDFLVNAFNEQQIASCKNLKLLIVGGNQNSEYVKYLASNVTTENIIFIPQVSNSIAMKYINASNYCLLPVNQIRVSPGSPLKLYDYIACGKQIITQDNVIGYSDEVLEYNLGYVVDFKDSYNAASNLIEISSKQNLETDFKIREIAVSELNWKNRMIAWINFFNNEY